MNSYMTKQLLLVFVLMMTISGFYINNEPVIKQQVQSVDWPYTICGSGSWNVTQVTLTSAPQKNSQNILTVVRNLAYVDRDS